MHRLLPQIIQENFAQGKFEGGFPAVGMYIDMSGFSNMTDVLVNYGVHGTEVLAQVMQAVFEPLGVCVTKLGGIITGMAGDAMAVLFPITEGDLSVFRRAIGASFEIQQLMRSSGLHRTPYGNFSIQAKVGIAIGEVRWGIIRSEDENRAVYYFQGSAIDGSTEAESHSSAGQIVLDAQLARMLGDEIVVEPQGEYFRLLRIQEAIPEPQPILPGTIDQNIEAYFFPKSVLQQTHKGEFRHLVNVLINLPTLRNEAQLASFMQIIFDLQERYGGFLNKLDFGDKGVNLLLLWGTPVKHENDIDRALNFILQLQGLTSIPVNAGITYVVAYAGFIGSTYLEDYTGYGRGINLAARFMTRAPRGEIWVDEEIYDRAKFRFDFEELGEMVFKGFKEPQPVYVLIERKIPSESIYTGELVGRDAECNRLTAFIQPISAGKFAGVMLVVGEAGIGKSRLVHEFRVSAQIEQRNFLWAVCQTDEIVREPLNPFHYWLQSYFDQSHIAPETRNKRHFNRVIDNLIFTTSQRDPELAEELDRVRSFIGALLELHWPDSLYEQLDPQGRYENTLIALADLLQAESLIQPVVLFIEDAQWLDSVSKEFLPRLVRILTAEEEQSFPIAILATARPAEDLAPALGESLSYEQIDLGGITGSDLIEVTQNILKKSPSPALTQLLDDRAEGNPFYIEQLVRYLQEQDRLFEKDGLIEVKGDDKLSPLPVDVGEILIARLDRLAQQVRNVVQTASILGREFEVRILSGMLRNDRSLVDEINDATEAAIWRPLSELHYIFNHILMQNAAYNMLLLSQRRDLHTLAVESIEIVFSHEISAHYGELAYHSEMANLVDKARGYLEKAGDVACNSYQNQEAINYYTRALSLTPPDDLPTCCRILLSRESLYFLLGDLPSEKQDLDEVARLLQNISVTQSEFDPKIIETELLGRRARYELQAMDYLNATKTAERTVALARETEQIEVSNQAYITWSMALDRQGKFRDAIRVAEMALDLSEKHEYLVGEARALNMMGMISWDHNDYENANQYLERCLQIATETNERRILLMVMQNLGNLKGSVGDYSAALDFYLEAVHFCREVGDRPREGLGLSNLSWISGLLGDYPSARSYAQQALRITRQVGDQIAEAYSLMNLSSFAGQLGDHEAALSYAQTALSLVRQLGEPSGEAWALTYSAHALLGRGQIKEADGHYREALQIRQRLDQPHLACEPLAGLARVALQRRDPGSALSYVREILDYMDSGGELAGLDEPMRVYLTCYQVLLANHVPGADQILDTAYHLLLEQSSRISDELMRRAFLENVPYHQEIQAAWQQNH